MQYAIKTMSQDEIDRFLAAEKMGFLSLTDGETPYAIPLAYFYDTGCIHITIRQEGRKMAYISRNKNVCFAVCRVPEDFGMKKMAYTSVICDGVLEHVTDPDELRKAVRAGEKHLGMPEGAWNGLLEKTLQNTGSSSFWKIRVESFGGKKV
jgi:nitroimidazol reductase NimA-like FMN-containing flavoprotein (pyridoxamine 5'-phosphate oxidase superfamily)